MKTCVHLYTYVLRGSCKSTTLNVRLWFKSRYKSQYEMINRQCISDITGGAFEWIIAALYALKVKWKRKKTLGYRTYHEESVLIIIWAETHLLHKVQSLVAAVSVPGGREATKPGEKLRFQSDHVETSQAERQEAESRGRASSSHRCYTADCGVRRMTARVTSSSQRRGEATRPAERGSESLPSAKADAPRSSTWPTRTEQERAHARFQTALV